MSARNAMAAALLMPLLCAIAAPTQAAGESARVRALESEIAALAADVEQLEDARAVKRLQRAYGYYMDRALWTEVADLFADDGTLELGADGVYVGKARILEYLKRLGGGRVGLRWGALAEHLQLQPVVHVAPDGLSARARWRDVAMLGQFQQSAAWGEGVQENEYVKRNGVWMIKSLHLYTTFVARYESGWARLEPAGDWRSPVAKEFPPDRPPTQLYKPFPDVFVPPFHYRNPVQP